MSFLFKGDLCGFFYTFYALPTSVTINMISPENGSHGLSISFSALVSLQRGWYMKGFI